MYAGKWVKLHHDKQNKYQPPKQLNHRKVRKNTRCSVNSFKRRFDSIGSGFSLYYDYKSDI